MSFILIVSQKELDVIGRQEISTQEELYSSFKDKPEPFPFYFDLVNKGLSMGNSVELVLYQNIENWIKDYIDANRNDKHSIFIAAPSLRDPSKAPEVIKRIIDILDSYPKRLTGLWIDEELRKSILNQENRNDRQ